MWRRLRIPARRAPLLMAAAYLSLGAAWLGSNPPSAAPDEPEHYLRALAIGRGDVLGEPTAIVPTAPENAAQAAHLARTTRSVLVPTGLAIPPSWFCTNATHDQSASCLSDAPTNDGPIRQATNESGSQPFLYIPSGLAPLTCS